MLGIHHIPSEALLTCSPFPACEAVWTHCLARTSGALQPATWRTMGLRATAAFHSTLAHKINLPIIIIIVMQLASLCRRTPFMISSLHVTQVMMLL